MSEVEAIQAVSSILVLQQICFGGGDIMQIEKLKQLVQELELSNTFDNIEAENCSACCTVGGGGNVGC